MMIKGKNIAFFLFCPTEGNGKYVYLVQMASFYMSSVKFKDKYRIPNNDNCTVRCASTKVGWQCFQQHLQVAGYD
ncbi:hypothetical protein EUGRSUZ_B02360 [Eucalyptus grandis]|uniref:Uncharacterized protein n=2 Tax=Eucalyptus grandis TaxID=71139 RepID=A0ACC3LSX9_EUCGR|nr:hypothetical protein EUGRSUZ_B02360 [Eucalyptus grandis]